jgi:hypothetical protein
MTSPDPRYPSTLAVLTSDMPVSYAAARTTMNCVLHITFPRHAKVYHLKCAPKGAQRIEVTMKLSCAKCGGTIPQRRWKSKEEG